MIDPVRMGPVGPVTAQAAATSSDNAVRRLTPQDFRKPADTVLRAPVPRLLDLVADLAQSGPPVDYVRIAQVRRAIADGSYRIDANALAKAILNFAEKD